MKGVVAQTPKKTAELNYLGKKLFHVEVVAQRRCRAPMDLGDSCSG